MSTNVLEARVREIARELHSHQICRLYKIPNDIKIVDNELLYAERTPVDFMGFTVTGRAILLECKIKKSTSLALSHTGLKPHQLIALTEAHNAGGLGLVAWMNDTRVAVIDAGQVRAYSREKGRKSVAWKDIPAKFKHRFNGDPLRFFWPFLTDEPQLSVPG